MKKFLLGSLAFATMALTSCVQENEDLLNNTFEVFSGEIITSNSRTSLGSDNSVLWSDGDAINLFKKTGYYQKYKVEKGGSATASFVYADVNTTGSPLDQHYAVYPYAETNSISGHTISMDLSSLANQSYTASSFEEEKAVMVAKSTTTNLPFMNALSVIRVNLNIGGAVIDATVSSIKIASAANALTGNATVDMSQDKPQAVIAADGGKEITLTADNVALSQKMTPFYIMFPAGAYADKDLTVEVTAVLNGENKKCEFTLPAVTLERSVITTLSKTFLDDNEWTGTTEDAVESPWDGETVTMPELVTDDVTGEEYYSVDSASDLVGLATLVNGTASARAVSTGTYNFKLTKDIDLGGHNWTAIGTEASPFKGTFDGCDKTIKNLNIVVTEGKEGKAYLGLFGYAKDATIKNVTIENADINVACLDIDHSQGHIGAVTGSLEGTSTIENVTVKGDVKVYATQDANGASRVAVVAGGNSYGNVTMKNVHVIANEGSYLKANNNTGALAGQLQGKLSFENCSSNIDVTVNKFFAGGLVGIAAGDSKFINCHTTGDVAVVAGREGRAHDQYRVGGIAGGWADGKNNVCTLVNCSYNGEISGKNSDGSVAEPLDYMGYVGRGYTLNGCQGSKVIIDGVEYVQAFNTAADAGIYYIDGAWVINSAANLKLIADKVNSGAEYFEGKTIKLGVDIDLNNEEWAPIGTAVKDHGFCGNFDGNNKKIKNLKITNITPDADGYVYAGLFGVTENNTIKNLIIENVNIDLEGHIVAAAIAYPYYTTVENITVQGDIKIEGKNYTAGILAYTRRCYDATGLTISGNSGSTITGDFTVGGVISDIQTNDGGVNDVNYSNFKASGLTITANNIHVGGISGIICNQTLDGAIVENVTIVCDDVRKGTVSGSLGGVSTIKNINVNNVTGATNVIGGTYDNGSEVVANGDVYTKKYIF